MSAGHHLIPAGEASELLRKSIKATISAIIRITRARCLILRDTDRCDAGRT